MNLPQVAALVIVDVQKAIDDPVWAKAGERNNPQAEANMSLILEKWRRSGRTVIHVRHESDESQSVYRASNFKTCVTPRPGERVVVKKVNSAFIGTDLESVLHTQNISHLVVCGVITNNSVEATVRMAGNLGFVTYLVEDACFTFARHDYHGRLRSADEVHAMSLANLDGEYCTVVTTDDLLNII